MKYGFPSRTHEYSEKHSSAQQHELVTKFDSIPRCSRFSIRVLCVAARCVPSMSAMRGEVHDGVFR